MIGIVKKGNHFLTMPPSLPFSYQSFRLCTQSYSDLSASVPEQRNKYLYQITPGWGVANVDINLSKDIAAGWGAGQGFEPLTFRLSIK